MGRAKEGFLPSRTSEPRRLNLLLHQQQGGNAAPPDPQRCRENDHGSDFEKHPVFLKLSICLSPRPEAAVLRLLCICHQARHYSLKTLIIFLYPAWQLGLDGPGVSLILPRTSHVTLSNSFNPWNTSLQSRVGQEELKAPGALRTASTCLHSYAHCICCHYRLLSPASLAPGNDFRPLLLFPLPPAKRKHLSYDNDYCHSLPISIHDLAYFSKCFPERTVLCLHPLFKLVW